MFFTNHSYRFVSLLCSRQSSNFFPDYYTATILEWKPLLSLDIYKEIIVVSFRFLVREQRAKIYGFVIMVNHIHVIWQALGEHTPKEIQ